MQDQRAILVLEDGSAFLGYAFGAPADAEAEVVFNTSMTGYQEIATDPSYRGQMVVLTYPLIGNYGVNRQDEESRRPWIAALIVCECSPVYSHWAAVESLDEYLRRHGIPGIWGVDTRALTRRLRQRGTMRGVLTRITDDPDLRALTRRAATVRALSEQDLVGETSLPTTYRIPPPNGRSLGRVVVMDCGLKHNILRSLSRRNLEIIVVPHTATAEEILRHDPDGIVISNGPGDPAVLHGPIATVRALLTSGRPLFGICLGHQLIGLAAGGTTSRLGFGHHGANHPVKDLRTGAVHITSQNHEFQVDRASLPPSSGLFVSQINLNDGSVEGLAHRELPVFSVQYHPEGAPGPQDNQYLFDYFVDLCRSTRREKR